MRSVLAAALIAAVVPVAAEAQPAASGMYLDANAGLFAPTGSDMEGFNNGFGFRAAFGRRFSPNFAAELGMGWFTTSTDRVSAFDPDLGSVSAKLSISAVPLTVGAKLLLPAGGVEPYLTGGAGLYFARLTADVSSGFISGSASDSSTAPGLYVGTGATFRVSPRASLLVDARYSTAWASFDGLDGQISGLALSGGVAFQF
jgi:hypothetical protein